MTHSRNKKPTVKQVLKLVEQLSAEDREQLLCQLREDEFRRDIEKGIESADKGKLTPAEEVFDRLRKKAQTEL